jgi:hypothetical protein
MKKNNDPIPIITKVDFLEKRAILFGY